VAGACSADRRFVGLLFNPERAVDDEMGNTDGLKIFWSVMHHNGSY
jgi:phosphoribosylformylglycinamidine (FGAM) synthase-like amidotransferase family enzyme